MTLITFSTDGLQKTSLYKCLKSPASEDTSTSNMVNRPKDCSNLNDSTLPCLLIPVKAIQTKNVFMIDTQNIKNIC